MRTFKIVATKRYSRVHQKVLNDIGAVEMIDGVGTNTHIFKTGVEPGVETMKVKNEIRKRLKESNHKVI